MLTLCDSLGRPSSHGNLPRLLFPGAGSLAGGLAAGRHLCALLARLAQADCDRLLAARHFPSGAALERTLLLAVHRRLDAFRGRTSILGHIVLLCAQQQRKCAMATSRMYRLNQ